MNIKLVDSILTIIDSLTPEERELLESRIQPNIQNKNNQTTIDKVQDNSLTKRERKAFEPPLDEYIKITRDERIAQQDELINSCFGSKNNK
ncbi:hypothetical protein A5482_015630 (plasmid) [Cyanobacterium sp. IPPAS B-1200]|uniref:hypothetical protein n=1 Tax=Cyanobacterium sp. IPPAS B-1200 TaxID=1562720 RepID=UPI000852522B|nr:hypothetical protein [Cyanobacterium sp. IPPAS B-1200]OEJ78415.1 hypothetical protein A5482_13280 [Cyanobacterium sp. IPPAS B-1200]